MVPPRGQSWEIEKMKNSGSEAKKYLKTKEERSKTNLKRTQIECPMRPLDAQFELFGAAHVLAGDWEQENVAGFGFVRLAEIRRRGGKYKNSGNEAKKYLKTNDIAFSIDANCTHFRRRFAQIGR